MTGACWGCGRELSGSEYGRSESCPGCGRDTRSCRNCRHHDESSRSSCREPSAEPPGDKEKANFCEFFKPGRPKAASGGQKPGASGRDAFEALFKKKKEGG